MQLPKISVVTVNYNKAQFLETTIRSVLDQEYPNLEYIIIDGNSNDNSVDIIKKYADRLKYWISEKDEGMYHALQKGFSQSTGEIMGWLNSDDILHPQSLFSIAEMFMLGDVNWIQGHPTVIDESGRIVYNRPARNQRQDFYSKRYHDGIFVQQESTYWRRKLWEKAGSYISTEYKYAGDFELWMRFFLHEKLYNTCSVIGAFRLCKSGQLSTSYYSIYLKECDDIIDRINPDSNNNKAGLVNRITRKFTGISKEINGEIANIGYDFSKQAFYVARP